MVHPMASRGVRDFLESLGRSVATKGDGKHDLGVSVAQVLARKPQIGEAAISPERNLALRGPYLERSELAQARPDPPVHRGGDWLAGEEVIWFHSLMLP